MSLILGPGQGRSAAVHSAPGTGSASRILLHEVQGRGWVSLRGTEGKGVELTGYRVDPLASVVVLGSFIFPRQETTPIPPPSKLVFRVYGTGSRSGVNLVFTNNPGISKLLEKSKVVQFYESLSSWYLQGRLREPGSLQIRMSKQLRVCERRPAPTAYHTHRDVGDSSNGHSP